MSEVTPLGLSEEEQLKRALFVSAIEAGSVSIISLYSIFKIILFFISLCIFIVTNLS